MIYTVQICLIVNLQRHDDDLAFPLSCRQSIKNVYLINEQTISSDRSAAIYIAILLTMSSVVVLLPPSSTVTLSPLFADRTRALSAFYSPSIVAAAGRPIVFILPLRSSVSSHAGLLTSSSKYCWQSQAYRRRAACRSIVITVCGFQVEAHEPLSFRPEKTCDEEGGPTA